MDQRGSLLPTSLLLVTAAFCPIQGAEVQAQVPTTAVSGDDVNVRYAKALLRLAQAELRQATEANQTSPGTFSGATVERLRNNVAVAEERLRYARHTSTDLHAIHLRGLEGNLMIAELNLKNARRLNERVPGAVSAAELERLRLTVEVARLAIEKARSPEATESPQDHFQWQLDELRQELLRLQIRVAELETRG